MSTIRLVVFDLTGTLVDDGGAVLDAYRQSLAAEQIPFAEADLQAARGGSKQGIFRAFAERAFGPGEQAQRAAAAAFDRFDAALVGAYGEGPLAEIPGAGDCLAALSRRGLKLATNTGFGQALARIMLKRLGWLAQPFAAHAASDEVPEGRPAPYMIHLAMQRAGVESAGDLIVVGDTPRDLQAGCNAGAGGVVGVLTGSHGVESLGRVRHTHLLRSVAELPDLIAAEFNS
ncbi:MAG TPA: HAD family hydrolase [Dehalococcoidia bacterium]|nr:HAD family hydrolase [Dehalococcoidia bacterium]